MAFRGDVRRYAVSVLDNETMDSQEDIIRNVMDGKRKFISPQVFTDYLNKIPKLPEHLDLTLGSEEQVLFVKATINLNARANSYSKMVSEYFGTLGAEYLTLFLKFVVNYALIRMTEAGIVSQDVEITKEDILFAYVDCFEMLEHRYEWTHFYLVIESALVHKGAKYAKELEVLSSFDIGEPVQKGVLTNKIQEVYKIKKTQSRKTLKKYKENGFLNEINNQTVEIKKLPGERVERQDDSAVEMYNYALEKIEKSTMNKIVPDDWDVHEHVETQSKLKNVLKN